MSGLIVYCLISVIVSSGAYLFMYVIVFIRGLLVLLVRVASISFQEQGYNLSKTAMVFIALAGVPFFLEFKGWDGVNNLVPIMIWIEFQPNLVWLLYVVLLMALFTIRVSILRFKGFIRNI